MRALTRSVELIEVDKCKIVEGSCTLDKKIGIGSLISSSSVNQALVN